MVPIKRVLDVFANLNVHKIVNARAFFATTMLVSPPFAEMESLRVPKIAMTVTRKMVMPVPPTAAHSLSALIMEAAKMEKPVTDRSYAIRKVENAFLELRLVVLREKFVRNLKENVLAPAAKLFVPSLINVWPLLRRVLSADPIKIVRMEKLVTVLKLVMRRQGSA